MGQEEVDWSKVHIGVDLVNVRVKFVSSIPRPYDCTVSECRRVVYVKIDIYTVTVTRYVGGVLQKQKDKKERNVS